MTRTMLVLITFAVFALIVAAMWWGWRNRLRRQSFSGPVPPPSLGAPVLPVQTGVYVGSAFADSWQNRVAALGVREAVTATLRPEGVAAGSLFIPAEAFVEARLAPGLAGKVMGADGLLVVRWRHGDHEIDSGLRFDDKTAYPEWVRFINEKVAA